MFFINILKTFGKFNGKAVANRILAFVAVLAMAVSLIQPASIVKAADDTGDQRNIEKINSFTDTLVKGAENVDGKYVWNAKTDADDHRFTFRVDYSMSGVKELEPGAIKIWIPKTILKDRSGKYADYMDISVPSEDEYKEASDEDKKDVNYIWKESTDDAHKNCIEITNVKERTAGENGYFEVAYITNEQTFEYKDEVTYDADKQKYVVNDTPQSDPFYADISVTNTSDDGKPQTVTASANRIPVYINTTAEISSTNKRYPNKLYRQWQSTWGTQPKETEGKYFLVWEIISKIRKDPTQPFTFTINDTPVSKELHLIGYSMNSQSGPFTDKNYVTNQRSDSDHYDYVLTYYDPAEFKGKDYYELKNSVKATVTPEDKIDAPTHATSSKMWEWDTPKFVHPGAHFHGEKYGDNNWYARFGYYHDYSSYSLDQLQEQKNSINSIDTFRYYIRILGYPFPFTLNGDADNPKSYGQKKVTYQLSDDELYLEDKITTKDVGTDQLEFGIPEGAHRLDSSDYQFLYADWNVSSQFRTYDDEDKKFVTDPDGKYSSDDVVHFWVKTNEKDKHDGKYKEVASYNLGSGKASISDSSIVKELTRDRITFKSDKDAPSVTGIRFTTSNAYYYTEIEAYPMVRLKNSNYVMKKLFKDENPKNVTEDNCKNLIRLHNFSESHVYDSDNKLIYHVKNYAFDRAIRPKKESEIHKHIVSTGSNKIRKKYIIRWKITPRETLTTDSGTDYLVQDSGTFYDLLPKGTHLEKGSVDVETEKGMLSHSSFSYSIEEDYKGSGRDMITVKILVQAKYYNLYLNAEMGWDAIRDYGTSINNPVAYETGNDEIYSGYPDSGGKLSDANKGYMTGLDSKCTTNRFIYDEEPHNIDTLTAAVSGLKKQIKDEHDSSYSYETYTTPKGNYSYKIRFANTMTDKAKNMIFFDSLENYTNTVSSGKIQSDWHGVLKRFDTSQLKQMGIKPVVYVSSVENLSIDENHDLTDTKVWQKADGSTDLSKMHAFAIDCRKTADGKDDFVLNEGESISAVVYMKAPASVPDKGDYAKAYNNIYIQDTIMSGKTSSDFFIHQDYTEIRYRVSADISIHKQSTDDENKAIEGAKYTLKGKSAYGTEVNEEVTTGAQGNAVFENIEKGTYTLNESYSPIDWLLDRNEYKVTVNGDGTVSFGGKEATDKKIILKDSPRVHGDISFMKYSTAGSTKPVPDAKFRLSGKSKYGTDVMEYATSDDHGRVKFDNIEWGDYKLKEVETPDGYISDSTEHTAVISDSGIGGIEDAEMLKTGSAVIRNEPYHTVEISKQSSYDNAPLSGAEFRLTGTSDYGTPYDKIATSGENGLAEFTGLEAGTYIIQETKSPKDYFLDATKHMVKVNKDDTYTIDGLEKNDSHYYKMNNKPEENGKIIIKKKWKDIDKTKRPTDPPIIHITTDINKVPTYAVWRDNRNPSSGVGPFGYVDSDYQYKTKKVEYAKDITSADQIPTGAVRLDKNYDDPNAKCKIWGWLTDDGTMHYWTNAQTTKLTDGSNDLFRGMRNVESIEPYKIDTSNVTDMSDMFYNCPKLTLLDVSKFDTSHVTNMSSMFQYCESLKSLDVSKFDTSHVTNMSSMFQYCESLKSLDVSKFDTTNVVYMAGMFNDCESLTSLDLSNFDTSSVTDMRGMFQGCSSLTSLDVSKFDTSNVTNMSSMFDACASLTSLDVSSFKTTKVKNMANMFGHAEDYSNGVYGCSKLTSLNLSNFDTSEVENMSGMFCGCSSLSSIDVSSFKTSKVQRMDGMFLSCTSLSSIIGLSGFDTKSVKKMGRESKDGAYPYSDEHYPGYNSQGGMFEKCYKLKSIDLSSFDTSKVNEMRYMFADCSGLTSLNVSKFDTSNVTDMWGMFSGCSGLTSLDVSKFDTSKVMNMQGMFDKCASLTSLDVTKLDTTNVTNMSYMFADCSGLTSLDVTKLDTTNVTNMSYMFAYCSGLTSLDLSKFDTSNVTDMRGMFSGCSSLTSIYVSNKWNTDKVTYSFQMFDRCSNLPNYSSSSTDKTHANYGSDGYLTYKATPTAKADTSSISFASRLVSMILSRLAAPAYAADSASYVSTDEKHCKITKDGDTWTYEFSVADDSAKYYAYEDDVEGYTSSNDASSYGIVAKDEPLTITNTADDLPKEPKPASLSLSKTADGKQLVESDKPVEKYSHTANIDDTGKANGTYSNNLNTNDIVTIPGASKLHVKLYCSTESTSYDWACVWAGSHPDYTAGGNYSSSKLGSSSGKIGDNGYKTSMPATPFEEGDIDGDSVTFGFRSDGSIGYYGYYAVVTGKDADGNDIKAKVPSDTDVADIPSSYSDMAYMFGITLKNSDLSKLSGTKLFGDAVFTDGKAEVGVKAGETKTFSGLPGGTTYTITEKKYDDFIATSKNATGTLNAGDVKTAEFTNHYQKPKTPDNPDTPKEYNGFVLKKNVTGFYQKKQNYTFDVSFKKLDPDTKYTLSNSAAFTSDNDGYGYIHVKLGDKESVKFKDLPVGALYKVTEEGGDWASEYRVTNSASDGDIAQVESINPAEKDQSLSTEWETVDKGEDITVTFTNTVKKYQSLVLKKKVTGDAPERFKFRIDFTNLKETIKSDAGTIVPEEDNTASAEVYLGGGDEVRFSKIPVTAKYQITELANPGTAEYAVTDENDSLKESAVNTDPMKDLSTAVETVNEDENSTVTFTNTMPKSASIVLKKQVSGIFADKSKFFRFTISVAGAAKNQNYSIDLTNGSSEHDGKKNPMFIKTDANGHGSADVWLKHNDEIVLKNLPLDAKYSITEDAQGYEKSIEANGSPVKDISNRPVAAETVVFTNTNTAILPTGLRSRTIIAMICAAIVFLTAFFTICFRITRKGRNS